MFWKFQMIENGILSEMFWAPVEHACFRHGVDEQAKNTKLGFSW